MSYHSPAAPALDARLSLLSQTGLPVHDARVLTGEEGTAMVVLDDKTYTLRITRAGKLILTK